MNRTVRLWLVLSLAYAIGKFAVDLGVDGILSDSLAGWLAIPIVAAIQAALLVAVARRPDTAGGGGS